MRLKVQGRFFGLVLLGMVLFVPSVVSAEVRYTVTDLGTLGGNYSIACDINNLGQIAGTSVTTNGNRRAFLWENGLMKSLGILGGSSSGATAINDNGYVVGSSTVADESNDSHAFLWNGNSMVDLDGPYGVAWDINNENTVVGYCKEAYVPGWGVRWENETGTSIPSMNEAMGINNAGQIVGTYFVEDDYRSVNAIVWKDGLLTELVSLGGHWTLPTAINDAGQVVGASAIESRSYHAFLWSDGKMIDLGSINGGTTIAEDINNRGQIIGNLEEPLALGDRGNCWIYDEGQFFNLNDLISPDSGWSLWAAEGINDLGQIVGGGYINGDYHGFLLTPVPEPMTLAMVALGGLGVLNRRRF